MTQNTNNLRLVLFINRALSIELACTQILEARYDDGPDESTKHTYQQELERTQARARALEQALVALGGELDERQSLFAGVGANLRAVLDTFRGDALKVLLDFSDDFVTAQGLIASYMVIESAAVACGVEDLALLAQRHRKEVEEVSAWFWRQLQHASRESVVQREAST